MWTRHGSVAMLEQKHHHAVKSVVWEVDHLAVFCAAQVRTPQGEIEEDVGSKDKEQVHEEDL